MNRGISEFNKGAYNEAKKIFNNAKNCKDVARVPACSSIDSWIARCNEALRPKAPSQNSDIITPKPQKGCYNINFEAGRDAYLASDFLAAMDYFEAAIRCGGSKMQLDDAREFFGIVNEQYQKTLRRKRILRNQEDIFGDVFDYEGEVQFDKPNGQGEARYLNGTIYVGPFVDGRKSGRGSIIFEDGSRFEGDFVQDRITGVGVYFWPDGSRYEGEVINFKPHGRGQAVYVDGSVYEGEFINCEKHGYGVLVFADSTIYKGSFIKGKASGEGTMIWANGDVYEGDFYDNKIAGKGVLKFRFGVTYTGDFIDGKRTGLGKLVNHKTEAEHEGEFINNALHGQGTYTTVDLDIADIPGCRKYIGKWERFNMHGWGRCFDISGVLLYEGLFKDNLPFTPPKNKSNDMGE